MGIGLQKIAGSSSESFSHRPVVSGRSQAGLTADGPAGAREISPDGLAAVEQGAQHLPLIAEADGYVSLPPAGPPLTRGDERSKQHAPCVRQIKAPAGHR
jgi:hypothetical protein